MKLSGVFSDVSNTDFLFPPSINMQEVTPYLNFGSNHKDHSKGAI